MNSIASLFTYLCIGTLGGYMGNKLKLPAGTLVGAMLAVMFFKLAVQKSWDIPRGYGFVVQVLY